MDQRGSPVTPLTSLDDLRALVDGPGPFLTAYLPLGPADEERAEATALRWRSLHEKAAAAGAPEGLLDQVDAEVAATGPGAAGLVVVASEAGPLHAELLDEPPPDQAVWQPAPMLVPLIAARQRRQPHVVALVDRQGADITAHVPTGSGADRSRTATVDGDEHPIRKSAPGGWSQRRYQQRAEETWQKNMAEVAHELAAVVDRAGARVVAVGGDDRAVGLLVDDLPAGIGERVERIEVTRATDGSIDHLDGERHRVLAAWVDRHLDQALALYRQELGQDDRATAGAEDTAAALRMAQVATLLVPAGTPTGTGSGPGADEAIVQALATGADVQVVPARGDPDDPRGLDDLGALLRW